MKIEILGTGCYNCVKLETLIDEVAGQLGATKFEIERVNDEKRVLQYMPLDESLVCLSTASWSARGRFLRARHLWNGYQAFLQHLLKSIFQNNQHDCLLIQSQLFLLEENATTEMSEKQLIVG